MEFIPTEPPIACNTLLEGQTRACVVTRDGGPRQLIVVRSADRIRAYLNSCPHQGVRLDWQPGVFLDVAGEHLQCSMHGALFRPSDGLCISGPCVGRALHAVTLVEKDGVFGIASTLAIPVSAR